jgi:hypothetical protein
MSDEHIAIEVQLAPDTLLTHEALMHLANTGVATTRRLKTFPIELVVEGPQEVIPPPQDHWQQAGFIDSLRNVAMHLETVKSGYLLSPAIRTMVSRVLGAQRIEEFDDLNDRDIMVYVETFRNQLPQVQQKVNEFIELASSVRPMAVDVDFI